MRKTDKIIYKKIQLPFKIKSPVLAVGTQAKNTVCFAKSNSAYLSHIHADLNSPQDFSSFKNTVKIFLNKHPKIIACDLHPEYSSTKYIHSLQPAACRLQPIQHHHAHIASCMAENGLKNQKVIGVAFDGTGLGSDNTLWGAEFLICGYKNFIRKAHLKTIPLLGGENAILEPWRLAAYWLYSLYNEKFIKLNLNLVKKINRKKWQVLKKMLFTEFNSPSASSMGRLFDAAASLILAKDKVSFEAELAMELEKLAILATSRGESATYCGGSYKFKIIKKEGEYIIEPLSIFKGIVKDLKAKVPKEKIAYRFHLTVAEMVRAVCLILRKETRINKVVLSGGVFQNKLLLKYSYGLLYKEGFQVVTHRKLSSNDSGVSLGQAVIAGQRG